jgi:predicted 2-oxoglutarate/Fe(II)-dependent dioxygenase YbiX
MTPSDDIADLHAPVLVVPDLFSADLCRRLVAFWEAGEKLDGTVSSAGTGEGAVKADTKRRQDVFLPDGHALLQEVAGIVGPRIGPAVLKAFHFRIEVMEGVRIGCYDAAEQGFFRAHVDDGTPTTAHRRFAMSVNLNTGEYEGGRLRFPEFGPREYAPPPGGAVVFSCKLLHEALPVTKGRRFGLFTFFCSEADEQARLRVVEAADAGV